MLARVRPSTASTYLTAVKSLFKWLESVRAYPNVAADIKTVKLVGNIHRKDALTPAQAKRVLQVLKGDTLQAKRDFALVNLLIRKCAAPPGAAVEGSPVEPGDLCTRASVWLPRWRSFDCAGCAQDDVRGARPPFWCRSAKTAPPPWLAGALS